MCGVLHMPPRAPFLPFPLLRDRKFKQYVDLYAKDEDTFFKVGGVGEGGRVLCGVWCAAAGWCSSWPAAVCELPATGKQLWGRCCIVRDCVRVSAGLIGGGLIGSADVAMGADMCTCKSQTPLLFRSADCTAVAGSCLPACALQDFASAFGKLMELGVPFTTAAAA